jgi:hypothetical protein
MSKQWQAVAVRDGYALDEEDRAEVEVMLDNSDFVRIELVYDTAAPNDTDDVGRMPGSYKASDLVGLWEDFEDQIDFDLKFGMAQAMANGLNASAGGELTAVEEYAFKLLADGAESHAEGDLDEDDRFENTDDHDESCSLTIKVAHWVRDNPTVVLAMMRADEKVES